METVIMLAAPGHPCHDDGVTLPVDAVHPERQAIEEPAAARLQRRTPTPADSSSNEGDPTP